MSAAPRPDHTVLEPRRFGQQYVCSSCGTIVHNFRVHDDWHRRVTECDE